MRKIALLVILAVMSGMVSCVPTRNGESIEKDTPGGDEFFECWPRSLTIKPQEKTIDTIRTQTPAFLGNIHYHFTAIEAKCDKKDNSYTDDRISIERVSDMSFRFEYLSDDFSKEIIDLYFYPLDGPTYTHGQVQIYISFDF